MKVLIDEQLPVKVKHRLANELYEVFTVKDMGWLGKKNGELFELMIAHKFNVLITNDKNMYYQHTISKLELAILNINTRTNDYDDVMVVLHNIKESLNSFARQLETNSIEVKYVVLPISTGQK
jgi:predicted nuclease of predicted toxin-antitoxin system